MLADPGLADDGPVRSPDPDPAAAARALLAACGDLDLVKYAELAIPMFLVGEGGGAAARPAAADPLGGRLAALAATLARAKPALDGDDVAKLLELLAHRHFLPATAGAPTAAPPLPAGAPPVLGELVDALGRGRAIRLLNFHATPRYREAEFRRWLARCAELFEPITPANVAAAVTGRWPHARPGLMPALYEGYRDNHDVLVPLLEEHGFTGWFFLPTEFLGVPAAQQRAYAAAHDLFLPEGDEYPDDRIALSWDEARAIARRGHAFVCHTRTHRELTPDLPDAVLRDEIAGARADLARELGHDPDAFCWLEGAALGHNPRADAMLRAEGFRYLFSNFKMQAL